VNTFPVLLAALCVYAIGYRYYSAFIAAKALALDDARVTPSVTPTWADRATVQTILRAIGLRNTSGRDFLASGAPQIELEQRPAMT